MEFFADLMLIANHPQNFIYSVAMGVLGILISLMIIFAVIGTSLDSIIEIALPDDVHLDFDVDADLDIHGSFASNVFNFLKLGRVPFSIWFVSLLGFFGGYGWLLNHWTLYIFTPYIMIPVVLVCTFFTLNFWILGLEKILPKDQTLILRNADFVGGIATVSMAMSPTIAKGLGEVKYLDEHGNLHFLPTYSEDPDSEIKRDSEVIISHYDEISGNFKVKPCK